MLIVDALIQAFEKHGIDKLIVNDDVAQAIASDAAIYYAEEDRTSLWSTEAKELLVEVLPLIKKWKEESTSEQLRLEYGTLAYKIEEVLIKNK